MNLSSFHLLIIVGRGSMGVQPFDYEVLYSTLTECNFSEPAF